MKRYIYLTFTFVCIPLILFPQSAAELDARADEFFRNKEFTKAVSAWLSALDLEPDNEKIAGKIEMIYEMKHKKDISLQKAGIGFKKSRILLKEGREGDAVKLELSRKAMEEALINYAEAYRIDPGDQELLGIRDGISRLKVDIEAEEKKERFSREQKERYGNLRSRALEEMNLQRYAQALELWEEILVFVEKDREALEGARTCRLALENRIKFGKTREFIARGAGFFEKGDYKSARGEFSRALELDPGNDEAADYIDLIDTKLSEIRLMAIREQQAEDFYRSGTAGLANNEFDQASEDFSSALEILDPYRDARDKLNSIEKLKKEYQEKKQAEKVERINSEFQSGLIAFSENNYKKAIASFGATLALDPENQLARRYLDRAREAQNSIDEEVIDRDSPYYDIVNPLMISGRELFDRGLYSESRVKWEKILDLFAKNAMATEYVLKCDFKLNPDAYRELADKIVEEGKELLKEKNYSSALKKFSLIKSISPDYPGIDGFVSGASAPRKTMSASEAGVSGAEIERRYRTGMKYFEKGGDENIKKALAEFQWITVRDPENVKALIGINKIESIYRAGGVQEKTGSRALTENQKKLIRKHYYSGINFYSNNNFEQAIKEWRKVIAIDPDHLQARNNIRKCIVILER